MTESSKSKITVCILILPIAIVGILVCWRCWPIVNTFSTTDGSPKMMGAEIFSPANPTNRILFVDDGAGFIDREFFLYAERSGEKPQFVVKLQTVEETGTFRLGYVQWTKDGQVIVCSLILKRRDESDQPAAAVIAYDFSANKSIVPESLDLISVAPEFTASKWKESEQFVQKLIAAHGGLDDYKISEEMVRNKEKATSFQPNPKKP
jgi:hypothetical protein